MKKLFVLVILLASFVSVMPQSRIASVKFTTLVEATTQTGYVSLGEWSSIDSITISIAGLGELDADSIVTYAGWQSRDGAFYSSTALTSIAAVNVATATKFYDNAVGTTAAAVAATVLTGVALKGANTLKCVVYPADGCGTGNYINVLYNIWGIPKGGT